MKKILITQSNYIPWKGFFDSIALVDEVVLYDDMQFTRRDWRNRNKIKTAHGLLWLTIPVESKGKYHQKINETYASNAEWAVQHWKTIVHNYRKTPHFDTASSLLEPLYTNITTNNLSEINYWFLSSICRWMGITTPIRFSTEYVLEGDKTERLVNLCLQLNATDYYSGPAAKDYLDENVFTRSSINVHYFDYTGYPEYPQFHGAFEHGVSIVDLLMHTGNNFRLFMKYL
ncbi:MAG TPA: WbqC family protein [Chryseosolibacter sp.]